ncbi:unnamed protein product [Trifolium pratense]|uniref:Uncharacterized protein n=1 Tax=Trifolium pratense TaxID=57577 RepID=A0ACB0JE20_TRIPR|nr:unnamed protein product [Trifolium pratense]
MTLYFFRSKQRWSDPPFLSPTIQSIHNRNKKKKKVHSDHDDGSETRWHKTGKTRQVYNNSKLKGYKKILVLYTNYGKQRKPEKTNWVMHQYHLGNDEEEKEGVLVVSKVFYQTQPRQCGGGNSLMKDSKTMKGQNGNEVVLSFLDSIGGHKLYIEEDYIEGYYRYYELKRR